jgi:6-hydroxycyclohex-1-ene-1-carbonyl-CoA dehydrogenase
MMMQAARFYAKGEPLKVEEVPVPEVGADEVLVKVAGCGICQSDLEYIDLGVPTVKKPPITLGHEPAGTITKAGESVKGFKEGDTVLCGNIISCGVCRYCREGRDDICDNWVMLGNMIDGAYAQYMKIPAKNAYLLPPEIDPEYGCIVADAVSTPFHAVKDRSGLRIGDNVAIFGCGGLGMAAIQIATAMGGNVIAVDVFDAKLEIARKMGAVETINSQTTDAVKEIRRLTSGRGVDVAFEMIGRPETIVRAYKSVAKGGRLVQVGFSPKEVTLNLGRMMVNEIEVVGSCGCRSVDFPRLIELIRRGKIDIKSLVTHKFPLSQVNEALDVLRRGESIRVVLTPNK